MPSKTTTKKTNNKSSLKRRFDLTNRKVQFFVVIAIVAVLGGGYFTVRSFALTNLYTVDATAMKCTVPGTAQWGDCGSNLVTDSSKGSKKVLLMPAGGAAITPSLYFAANTPYQVCITAKGKGQLHLGGPLSWNGKTGDYISFDSTQYTQKCSENVNAGGGSYSTWIRVDSKFTGSYHAISSITVNRNLPTPTAPAPPAK